MPKASTADCPRVDISALRADGALSPGAEREGHVVESDRVITIRTNALASAVLIEFGRGWEGPLSACTVQLQQVHTRTYWLCPACGTRCRYLYFTPAPCCRVCATLRYPSAGLEPLPRALYNAQRVRQQLGWAADGPQQKPHGMHWRKFLRLVAEHNKHEATIARLISAHLS